MVLNNENGGKRKPENYKRQRHGKKSSMRGKAGISKVSGVDVSCLLMKESGCSVVT